MPGKRVNYFTGLTVVEEQAVIKWLEDAAVSASSESKQAIHAKNALRIIAVRNYIIEHQDNIINGQRNLINHQEESLKIQDDAIKCLMVDAPHAAA